MIERLAVLTALAVIFAAGSAATLGELEAWCAPPDKGGRPSLCEGYLEANLELLASPDPTSNGGARACVPPDEDRARIVGLCATMCIAIPKPAAKKRHGLGKALEGHFPCRENDGCAADVAAEASGARNTDARCCGSRHGNSSPNEALTKHGIRQRFGTRGARRFDHRRPDAAATTGLNQRAQAEAGQRAAQIEHLKALFDDFIVAASKSYGEALVSSEPKIEEIVKLYAMISRMRVLCSAQTVKTAEKPMSQQSIRTSPRTGRSESCMR